MTYVIIITCNALLTTVTSTKCSCTLLASIVSMTAEHYAIFWQDKISVKYFCVCLFVMKFGATLTQ